MQTRGTKMRLILGIGTGVVMLVMFLLMATFLGMSSVMKTLMIITAVYLYFTYVFPYATIKVPPNKAWVLANSFVSESAMKLETFSGYRMITGQKEFQAGFHWKFFWEYPDKEIDMRRQIIVENDPDENPFTLRDGKQIRIKWRIFCEPLPGNIVNFLRTRPESIEMRVTDRVNVFIQGYVGRLASIKFDKRQMNKLKNEFEKIFQGPTVIDDEERELGIWTGTPEIIDIDQPKEVQAAKNYQQKMEATIRVANEMVNASKGRLRYDQALKLALVGSGDAKIDFVELAGTLFGKERPSKKKNP